MRPPALVEESLTLRRVARRMGLTRPHPKVHLRAPLAQPIGLKTELTHRCNLRCGFCYTDSPRRTLEGTPDLSDDDWRRIVEQGLELGVIEAVITGGEPLLRKDLALELMERLSGEGVAVSLNTNGWFVDEALADRVAAMRGARVHVSLDGASPQVHDAARGVPGSWRRAVRAIDLLLGRGVSVETIHVVTPPNVATLDAFLEHMWLLGVRAIGTSTVVPIGAAAGDTRWLVDRAPLHRAIAAFRERHGDEDVAIVVEPPAVEGLANRDRAPGSILVRPDGTIRIDSMHPFSFGNADEGLAVCWERMRAGWRDEEIEGWARGVRSRRGMARASLVPYRDREVAVAGAPDRAPANGRARRGGSLMTAPPAVAPTDLEEARTHVTDLMLARRYGTGDVRWAGTPGGERYVRVLSGHRTYWLSETAGRVMDACSDGTAGDAVAALAERHPSVDRERLISDTLRSVRWLTRNGLLVPVPR